MSIIILPFQEIRLQDFKYDGIESDYFAGLDIKDIARQYAKMGDAFMGLADDEVIGLGGIYPVTQEIAQAWLFLNQSARQYKGAIFREIKSHLDKIIAFKGYKKVQILCLQNSFEAINLSEHLGFHKLADMVLYTKNGE